MWQGKHAQAPVAVAAKPHYFSELDVNRTMRNILKNCPEFFASDQFLSSVADGTITALDRSFFCQVWLHPVSSLTMSRRECKCRPTYSLVYHHLRSTDADAAMLPVLKRYCSRYMTLNIHNTCTMQYLQRIMLGACNACLQTVKAKPQESACRSCASCSLMKMQTSELPLKAV